MNVGCFCAGDSRPAGSGRRGLRDPRLPEEPDAVYHQDRTDVKQDDA